MKLDARALARALGGDASGNKVKAPGPGHSAHDRSLSIDLDPMAPGGFVVHSFTNDDPIQCKDYVREKAGLPKWEPERRANRAGARTLAEYVYHDDKGQPSRKVVRKEGKEFPQYRWTGSGWQAGVRGLPVYPYRLPDMLAAVHDAVFICEGEKDVDRLAGLGFVATTNPGGAGNWKANLNQWFAGKTCFVLEDNDEAGRKRCQTIARELHPVVDSVRIVTFRDLPEGGDVSDWLDAEPSRSGGLVDFARRFPLWTPETTEEPPQEAAQPRFRATPFTWTDPAAIPPREWLYGRHLIRKFVSVTVAPGGVGKSSLLIAEALALTTGKPLVGQWVGSPLRVWLWNLEDPRDELQRRIQAACQHYGLSPADIGDRLFIDTGREQELCTAVTTRNGAQIVRPAIDNLTAELTANAIDVLIVDPFISSHQVAENDNPAMDMVAKEWGRVADRTRSAIELVHHTRKLSGDVEVTAESSRGAKALTDAARDTRVLNRMSSEEGDKAGVENHRLYFRAYSDKANLSPPADKSDWFKLENVELANGDHVGVVTQWQWPDPLAGVTGADFDKVAAVIRGGRWRENVQASAWVGRAVAEALELNVENRADKNKILALLSVWRAAGSLVVVEGEDEKRMVRKFVEVREDS